MVGIHLSTYCEWSNFKNNQIEFDILFLFKM